MTADSYSSKQTFLTVSVGNGGQSAPEYIKLLNIDGARVERLWFAYGNPARRIFGALREWRKISRADIVVSDEYFLSTVVSLILLLTRSQAKHVVLALNVSTEKVLSHQVNFVNWIISKLFFYRMDLITVSSRAEIRLFHEANGIPLEKFAFIHWGYDLPDADVPPRCSDRPHFCMIGRNNRDIETFCKAMSGVEADGIVITSVVPDIVVPPNVRILTDLSMRDCMAWLKGAVASVVLVKDKARGAGHITIVSAMLMGKPQILTRVDTMADYYVPGLHAFTVSLQDVDQVRSAMRRILTNPAEASEMGEAARSYAERWLGHDRRVRALAQTIGSYLTSETVIQQDEDWLAEYTMLSARVELGS